MSNSKYQFCHCKSIRSFACSKRIVTKSKIFSIADLETFARAAIRKTKIYIYVASLIACCSLTIHWNDMYLPTLHFVTVPLTCANYLAQSLRFSKQNVYYVCLVDATVLRGSCLAQKNLCPDSGKPYQRWFFLGRIYQNVFNKRIRPTKINPRNSRSSNRSERV